MTQSQTSEPRSALPRADEPVGLLLLAVVAAKIRRPHPGPTIVMTADGGGGRVDNDVVPANRTDTST